MAGYIKEDRIAHGNYEDSRNMENCFKLKIGQAKWYVPYQCKYVRSIWTKDDSKMQKWKNYQDGKITEN